METFGDVGNRSHLSPSASGLARDISLTLISPELNFFGNTNPVSDTRSFISEKECDEIQFHVSEIAVDPSDDGATLTDNLCSGDGGGVVNSNDSLAVTPGNIK